MNVELFLFGLLLIAVIILSIILFFIILFMIRSLYDRISDLETQVRGPTKSRREKSAPMDYKTVPDFTITHNYR